MIGALVIGIIAIAIILLGGIIGVLAMVITGIVGLCIHIPRYNKLKTMKPSEMTCVYCGSHNIRLNTIATGTTYHSMSTGKVLPGIVGPNVVGGTNGTSKIEYRHEAECLGCGYKWDFTTQEDINQMLKKEKTSLWVFGLLTAMVLILL